MSVRIDSTTDNTDAVTAALGNLADKAKVGEIVSAPVEKTGEKKEASDASKKADEAEPKGDAEDAADDDSDSDGEEPKPKKKSNGFKKRIDKLNSRLTEREREIEYWKSQALKETKPQSDDQAPAKKPEVSSTDRPKAETFDSHEDYLEALVDWKADQKLKKRDDDARQAKVKTEFEEQVKSHLERVESYKASKDDWDDVVESVDDIHMSPVVQEAILQSENGPELMYELAKNREEYARICKLSPVAAARELGKFEARIQPASQESKLDTKDVKKTKAPPPIKPVGSKASASTKSPDEMSFQEFKRWREEQLRK